MWEGIGVVSFLLISFWYTRIQAVKSAIQALTMNRVGDMMLSVGLFAMIAIFGNLNYSTIFSASPYVNEVAITVVVLLLFIGATAKSAQVPLHVWLPGSMEGTIYISIFGTSLFLFFLSIFKLLTFLYFYFFSIEYCSLFDLTLSLAVINKTRGKDGKFISVPSINLEPLNPTVKEALIGELLGDGCLRYTKKVQDGNPNPNWNVNFAMALKSYEHIIYLWENTYSSICTNTPPRPWPPVNSGKPVSQYAFSSKSLLALTEIHKEWYGQLKIINT